MKRTTRTLAIIATVAALALSACSTGLESPSIDAPETETETVAPAPSGPSWFQDFMHDAFEKARQEALAAAQEAATQAALDAALAALPEGPFTFPKP